MLENIDNIKLINITGGPGSISRDYICRPFHGLIYKIDGVSTYYFKGQKLTLHGGEIIYIPKGDTYHVEKTAGNEGKYVALNFDCGLHSEPFILKYNGNADIKQLPHLWLMGSTSDKYRCISAFYDILAGIASDSGSTDNRKSEIIKPACDYLKTHIFKHDLSVGMLHEMCGISDVYFRRLFIEIYGMPPQKYVIDKRLTEARSLIENGDYDNLYSVAYSVGYDDPLYFSREFKRKFGVAPSAIL